MEDKRVAPTPVVPASTPDPPTTRFVYSPFVGLCHYEVDEADRFFGRAAEAAAIRALISRHRLVVVSGPAAIGTSSLLRAGVIAGFDPAEVDLLPITRLGLPAPPPGDNPFVAALLSSWAHTLDPQGP